MQIRKFHIRISDYNGCCYYYEDIIVCSEVIMLFDWDQFSSEKLNPETVSEMLPKDIEKIVCEYFTNRGATVVFNNNAGWETLRN